MTSKAVLKIAEELLDCAFRDAEGQADRKVDVVALVDEARTTIEKAEPALEYLLSRGLIHPPAGDGVYLTTRGVDAMIHEQDIKAMPKYEKAWGGGSATPAAVPLPIVAAAPAHPRPYSPMLSFVDPSGQLQTFELTWSATVGRSDDATLTLPDPRASKRHVEIKYAGDKYVVRDMGSANGTMVNGQYVELHPLVHGDVLLIGRTEVTYTCPEVMPEPHGEPPADMVSARPRPPLAGEPTARPAPGEVPPTSRSAGFEAARAPEGPRSGAYEVMRPDAAREAPKPDARGVTTDPIPGRSGGPRPATGPVAPARVPTPHTAPGTAGASSAALSARRRTAGTPLGAVEVPIVKGRPEAPPAAAPSDPSGLFDAVPPPPPGDLFGDAPTLDPSPAASNAAVFDAPPRVSRDDADLFEADTPAALRAPLLAPSRAGSGRGDLFESDHGTSPGRAPQAPDLFGAGAGQPRAPDLFAPAGAGAARAAPAPDLFAPRHDQGPGDLFAPDFSGTANTAPPSGGRPPRAPDLFGGDQPTVEHPPLDEIFGRSTPGVSPLPSSAVARPPEDILPLEEPVELDLPVLEPPPSSFGAIEAPIIPLDAPVDDSDGATLAGINPFLAAAAIRDASAGSAPHSASDPRVTSGRTGELPAWDRVDEASLTPFAEPDLPLISLDEPPVLDPPAAAGAPAAFAPGEPTAFGADEPTAFGHADDGSESFVAGEPAYADGVRSHATDDALAEDTRDVTQDVVPRRSEAPSPVVEELLMVGPPDDGGFEERTPVEEPIPPAAPSQILAAASDLPEAPSALEDLSGDVMGPIGWARFADTLMILRARLGEAGVPDRARLEEAIDLLRKHPSVKAALTD